TQSGTFDVLINDVSVEKRVVTLNAQMGVWYGSIVLSDDDLWYFTRIFLRRDVFFRVLKIALSSLFKSSKD
ncbi:MAG: hypothetical protein GTO02_23215, partial [Candidatus Dadabacteria bacterium]|nr:hypothetical protein [Candidatus Dadabacteria bacterium]NIQ17182.1 hypothetical protein [Candidatus Dadabacteria bacterium]